MTRRKVLHGCQLCGKLIDHRVLESHHLIPQAWQRRHPEAERTIKGGSDLTLSLCPDCHRLVHVEMRERLSKDPSEEEMHKFVDDILRRRYY